MQNQCIGLDWNGQEIDPESNECIAKKIGDHSFYLKIGTAGAEAGRLYNPLSCTFDERNANRFNPQSGEGYYKFIKVSQEAYEYYVQFIATKQTAHCLFAERTISA